MNHWVRTVTWLVRRAKRRFFCCSWYWLCDGIVNARHWRHWTERTAQILKNKSMFQGFPKHVVFFLAVCLRRTLQLPAGKGVFDMKHLRVANQVVSSTNYGNLDDKNTFLQIRPQCNHLCSESPVSLGFLRNASSLLRSEIDFRLWIELRCANLNPHSSRVVRLNSTMSPPNARRKIKHLFYIETT